MYMNANDLTRVQSMYRDFYSPPRPHIKSIGESCGLNLQKMTFLAIWRWKWQPTPVLLPGESHGQRSLAGYSPRGHRSQTPFSD